MAPIFCDSQGVIIVDYLEEGHTVNGVYFAELIRLHQEIVSRPRWLSWMRHPTGDQEVAGSTPAEVGNILSWRLIVKYFLRSFSPFR